MILSCHRVINLPSPLNSTRSLCSLSGTVTHRGGGIPLGVTMKTIEERFLSKINKDGPIPKHAPELGKCWLWNGAHFTTGYGKLLIGGKFKQASRVAYQLFNGELKNFALHKCDNRGCCNPSHIYDGDNFDNMADRLARGTYPTRHNGHKKAKITGEKFDRFKVLILSGKSPLSIASDFGVHPSVAGKLAAKIRKGIE